MQILIPVIILTILGLIVGLGLSLAAKFMAVPVDQKEEKIRECLPGANCGACGYSGCDGYAAAIASGEAEPNKCSPGGASTSSALSEILGISIQSNPMVAVIACGGNNQNRRYKFTYTGLQSCAAASLVHRGPLQCEQGCLGFGDCAKACPFGAIRVKDGKIAICHDICVGCGKCALVCPKSLIHITSKDAAVFINCSNTLRGGAVSKSCDVSCVACGLCEKSCPNKAIKIENNLAVIDYSLCTACGKCREVCKRGIII